jgi:hypothetical protein
MKPTIFPALADWYEVEITETEDGLFVLTEAPVIAWAFNVDKVSEKSLAPTPITPAGIPTAMRYALKDPDGLYWIEDGTVPTAELIEYLKRGLELEEIMYEAAVKRLEAESGQGSTEPESAPSKQRKPLK